MTSDLFSEEGGRVRFAVRVTPRSGRDVIVGRLELPDGRSALAIRLAAPPVDGAANEALVALIARSLCIARSGVAIVSGETGRVKIVAVDGLTAQVVSDRLQPSAR